MKTFRIVPKQSPMSLMQSRTEFCRNISKYANTFIKVSSFTINAFVGSLLVKTFSFDRNFLYNIWKYLRSGVILSGNIAFYRSRARIWYASSISHWVVTFITKINRHLLRHTKQTLYERKNRNHFFLSPPPLISYEPRSFNTIHGNLWFGIRIENA